ncbi:MAG: urease accessory protein UreD [Xanthobacteraceae bacterium]
MQYVPGETLAQTFAANRAHGLIALTVELRAGFTRRARIREQGPLRVRCPGAPRAELEAVIVNTAGGVAGGDRHEIAVEVAPAARLTVTSAAAEKIYRSSGPSAQLAIRLKVGAAGALSWLPQECILYDNARMERVIEVDLAGDASLIMAEAIVLGRSGMGENVQQCRLFDRWNIRRGGVLLHVEAMRLDGAVGAKLAQRAVARGDVALATVFAAPADDGTAALLREVTQQCAAEVGISAWNGFLVARLCAPAGAALRRDLITLLTALRKAPLPRLWLN